MERFKLKLEARESKTPNELRRSGKIPATLYGPDSESATVQVIEDEFVRLPGAAYSHVIELESPDGPVNALIRHVQRRATTHKILNVEFYRVAAGRKLTVTVPLKFVGVAPAVQKGGVLVEMFQTADIECVPSAIPDFIEVDVTRIENIDAGLHFSDLKVPAEVKVLNPMEELVARVIAKKGGGATPGADKAAPAAAAAPAEKAEKK
ncbi:MAG: 50S ribosomal protein L25 [Candidatus Obscuribacterales bacterium]|nr:50S ribosomal protein L25 [Candidatus Obscuribacterales bacterium]